MPEQVEYSSAVMYEELKFTAGGIILGVVLLAMVIAACGVLDAWRAFRDWRFSAMIAAWLAIFAVIYWGLGLWLDSK